MVVFTSFSPPRLHKWSLKLKPGPTSLSRSSLDRGYHLAYPSWSRWSWSLYCPGAAAVEEDEEGNCSHCSGESGGNSEGFFEQGLKERSRRPGSWELEGRDRVALVLPAGWFGLLLFVDVHLPRDQAHAVTKERGRESRLL